MASFVLFGVPYGFDTSECTTEQYEFLSGFYTGTNKKEIDMKVIRRRNNDVCYIFLVNNKPGCNFCDANGRPGSFFGMALILNNQYITDTNKMYNLFQKTYDNYVKNKIIIENTNGTKRYKFNRLNMPGDKLGYFVCDGFSELIRNNFELNIWQNLAQLPPMCSIDYQRK